ncbi:MAG: hypothetical protein FWG53_02855 [Clostridiales bacterium]|nr:hypothetical protein [Clostridiales bacterium]
MKTQIRLNNWMHDLMDEIGDVDLRQLKIPSTHNSGVYSGKSLSDIRCQDYTIAKQLEIGVRALDVRVTCRVDFDMRIPANTPPDYRYFMHHAGVFQPGQEFKTGLADIKAFLERNNGEVVLLFVRPGDEQLNYKSNWVYGDAGRVLRVKDMIREELGKYMYKPNPAEGTDKHSFSARGGTGIKGKLTLNRIVEEKGPLKGKSRVMVFISDLFSSEKDDSDFWLSGSLTEGSYNSNQAGVEKQQKEKGACLPHWVFDSLARRDPSKFHVSDWTLWDWIAGGGILKATSSYAHPCLRSFLANPGGSTYFRNTNLVNMDFVREDITRAIVSLNTPGYVSDVIVEIDGKDHSSAGYTKINWDLNAGAGGKYIYLWYKLSADASDAYTNFFISFAKRGGYPNEFVTVAHNGVTAKYWRFAVDLNAGAGGAYLYLHGTKDKGPKPIRRLFVSSEEERGRTIAKSVEKVQGAIQSMVKEEVKTLNARTTQNITEKAAKMHQEALQEATAATKKAYEREEFVLYHNTMTPGDCNGHKGEKIFISMMRES